MKHFTNNIENQDIFGKIDLMLKFHEYLAKRDGISLEEAARRSLARTWELAQTGKVMTLITAFIKGLSYEQNVERNISLTKDIRDNDFGYTPLYGYWTYKDKEKQEKVQEDSLLVSAPVSIGNKDFKSKVLEWILQYQQEAAVIKYADSDIAYLLLANGNETKLGKWSINKLAEIYSQMKFGQVDRMFVFEAADDYSWATKLAIFTMEKN